MRSDVKSEDNFANFNRIHIKIGRSYDRLWNLNPARALSRGLFPSGSSSFPTCVNTRGAEQQVGAQSREGAAGPRAAENRPSSAPRREAPSTKAASARTAAAR